MPYSQPCNLLVVESLHEARSFLKSDAAHVFLALLAIANAVQHYLSQSRLPEARQLAAVILVGMVFAVLVAASESRAPRLMVAGLKCNSQEVTKYAAEIELRNSRGTPAS